MTKLAPSAAPSNPLLMWTDGRDIFVEFPAKRGSTCGPAITKLPLSEQGLWRALNLLRTQTYDFAGTPITKPIPKLDVASALAERILRKNGVLR